MISAVDPGIHGDETVAQRFFGHFQRENDHALVFLHGHVLGDVQCESGLTHGRTRRDDDEVGLVQAVHPLVQILEVGGDAGQRAASFAGFLDGLEVRAQHVLHVGILRRLLRFRDVEDRRFRVVHDFIRVELFLVALFDDAGRRRDQPPQHRLFGNDAGVLDRVGSRRNDRGQKSDISPAADGFQVVSSL